MGFFGKLLGRRPRQDQSAASQASGSTHRLPASQSDDGPSYAVIDVETTGLSPRSARVLELAIVRVNERGVVVDEYVQRFNPEGPVGATHILGIRDTDVVNSPLFHQVSGAIADRVRGLPLVAHNASFDLAFLHAEMTAAGWDVPHLPSYCTLQGSHDYLPAADRRRLIDCCWEAGVTLTDAHSALGDARATAGLLRAYLAKGGPAHAALRVAADQSRRSPWPTGPARAPLARHEQSVSTPRQSARPERAPKSTTPALMQQLTFLSLAAVIDEGAPSGTTAYIELLLDALEDGEISPSESEQLDDLRQAYALSAADTSTIHEALLLALAHIAVDDGHVSHAERAELSTFAELLAVDPSKVQTVIAQADAARHERLSVELRPLPEGWNHGNPVRVGDRVVFTGCDERQRERLEIRASKLGVRVMGSVSRLTTMLISDGTFAGTKKAKADELGIRTVHPDLFEFLLTHLQPALPAEVNRPAITDVKKKPTTSPPRISTNRPTPAAIRVWALANGFDVGTRGRIHSSVLNAYAQAHPEIASRGEREHEGDLAPSE